MGIRDSDAIRPPRVSMLTENQNIENAIEYPLALSVSELIKKIETEVRFDRNFTQIQRVEYPAICNHI